MNEHSADQSQETVPLSGLIESLLDEAGARPVHMGELVDRAAERGFGMLMVVLGLPMLIPVLPPGSSTVVGSIYALFAFQMLSGATVPWVPARIRDVVLSEGAVTILRRRGIPLLRSAERMSRPRGVWAGSMLVYRVAAVMVLLMGLVLLSPLPFMNVLPTIVVMLIGLGLLNRDAVFMLAGLAVGSVAMGLVVLSAGTILILIERIRRATP